jgi:hypothetical protein
MRYTETLASSLFAAYCKSAPTFIDEFLAREGIITKNPATQGTRRFRLRKGANFRGESTTRKR